MRRASGFLEKLRVLYPSPEWALFPEVRSGTGTRIDAVRYADALAVNLLADAWEIHGFERKENRNDWRREFERPEKSAPIAAWCCAWWLVVPAPWKRVVLALSELPEGWGLVELGTGRPSIVLPAAPRRASDPPHTFVASLLRSASRLAEGDPEAEAPMVAITRPHLSRSHVGLACGHVAPRPLAKVIPLRLSCLGCAEGRPADREVLEAMIDEASPEALEALAERIEARRPAFARIGGAS
jgi:hypothetical protein